MDVVVNLKSLLADPLRSTLPDTLKQRTTICIQQMAIGGLDYILDTDPLQVLKQLMGINGELLPRLNIDPMQELPPETVRVLDQGKKVPK